MTKVEVSPIKVPFFGARKIAVEALTELSQVKKELDVAKARLHEIGALTLHDIQQKTDEARRSLTDLQEKIVAANSLEEINTKVAKAKNEVSESKEEIRVANIELSTVRKSIIVTEEIALLQEVGFYEYRHPLTDAAAYQEELKNLQEKIKAFNKDRERAISSMTGWTVNGSAAQGKRMLSDFSKLMLQAFNAEADTLVRGLKPYKLERAIERLRKVSETISKLGKTMGICITSEYLRIRIKELELTADFIDRQAKEKEEAREERARLQEERKAQAELERERERLEKEKRHYENALAALRAKGDDEGAQRLMLQLGDVEKAINDVDYRAANIRAGYVYVISNIGAFGHGMVKVGMTRRLDPMDRVNELGDASVPFRFDVHALFFSQDAVGIESQMHARLAPKRVNKVNMRREFFHCSPADAKSHLSELAGELLEFVDVPEAMEYRQSQ